MTRSIAFVDSITASPVVRLGLDDDGFAVLAGVDFGTPEIRRSTASTMLSDGDRITAAAYGNRLLSIPVDLRDADPEKIARLYAELSRERNLLRVEAVGSPVFFRTYRASDAVLELLTAGCAVVLEIPAEPFAYGLRRNLAPVTVKSALAGACYFDVNNVVGDVETPLHLEITDYGSLLPGQQRRTLVLGSRRRGNPSEMVLHAQLEDGVLMGAEPLEDGVWVRSPGTAYMQTQVITTWPNMDPSEDVRGTYRMFAAVRVNTAGDHWALRMSYGSNNAVSDGDVRLLRPVDAGTYLVDLGLLSIPYGGAPVTSFEGSPLPAAPLRLEVACRRDSGSGSLDWDLVFGVPADAEFSTTTLGQYDAADAVLLDGPQDAVYPVNADGVTVPFPLVPRSGCLPMVAPGDNRIVCLSPFTDSGSMVYDREADFTVARSYWPRYLTVSAP